MTATIHEVYTFSAMYGVTVREACEYTAAKFDAGIYSHKMSNSWASKLRTGKVKAVQPEKLAALEDALIDLAHQRGTLPVTDKDKARSMGIKKLIGRMVK